MLAKVQENLSPANTHRNPDNNFLPRNLPWKMYIQLHR